MADFVDFHCHLDLYPDPASAIAQAEAAGVKTLTVTTTPRAWSGNLKFIGQARYIRPALGLHPQVVAERADEIVLWENLLPEARFVGEVGLDAGPRFYSSFRLQKEIFERILRGCASAGGKVLTVHSVRAAKVVLDMIEIHLPRDRGSVVMHWFTGSRPELRRAVEMGCYFSVNTAMAASENGRKLIAEIPSERLLTETDGPFTQSKEGAAHPKDVRDLLPQLAAIRGGAATALEEMIATNLRRLCGEW